MRKVQGEHRLLLQLLIQQFDSDSPKHKIGDTIYNYLSLSINILQVLKCFILMSASLKWPSHLLLFVSSSFFIQVDFSLSCSRGSLSYHFLPQQSIRRFTLGWFWLEWLPLDIQLISCKSIVKFELRLGNGYSDVCWSSLFCLYRISYKWKEFGWWSRLPKYLRDKKKMWQQQFLYEIWPHW